MIRKALLGLETALDHLCSLRARPTLQVRAFGLLKVPLLAAVRPVVLELDAQRCVVRIPLRRFTRNHLGSMYFGALAIGADVAGGLLAFIALQESRQPISLIFKDLHAEFFRRAEGDVHFTCESGAAQRELVERAASTGERVELPVTVVATVPELAGNEPVARFVLTLSLKRRDR